MGLALFQTGWSTKNWADVYRSWQILSHVPQRDSQVLATLGSILLQQGRREMAVSLYRQAIAAEPANARFVYLLGVALDAQGNRQDAISALRHSIELDRSVPDPYRKLSEIYERMGLHSLSKQTMAEYLKVMPQNIALRRNE